MNRKVAIGLACCALFVAACDATSPGREQSIAGPAGSIDAAAAIPSVPASWPFPLDQPAAAGEHGMVVTDQPLATEVGLAVLRDGGNAVDAAVATAFALAVVLPERRQHRRRRLHGRARRRRRATRSTSARPRPAAAKPRHVPRCPAASTGDRSVTGHLAAGVPGSVAGLWAAHQKLGSKPWAELVAAGDPPRRGRLRGRRATPRRHQGRSRAAARAFPRSAALYLRAAAAWRRARV